MVASSEGRKVERTYVNFDVSIAYRPKARALKQLSEAHSSPVPATSIALKSVE